MARPKLTKKQIGEIEEMAGCGMTVAQIAGILGLSKKTLERRVKGTSDAFDALEKGRAKAARQVTATAYGLAISGQSPAMTMFWLKCRAGWTEKQVLEHTGRDGGPIETVMLTPEQRKARIDELIKKRGS